ncbi:MAG TPA: lamin tail domain-containing protein, partial [Anaerolineaceae bacterium]
MKKQLRLRNLWVATSIALILALVISFLPAQIQPVYAVSPNIVISQVYGGGGGSGYYLYDYVELFNLGGTAVDIGGWSVQYGSAAGNFGNSASAIYAFPGATIIQPGKYLFVQLGTAGTAGTAFPVTPDITTTNLVMSQASGKVALANISTVLGCGATATPCTLPDSRIVDSVSFGAANNGEGGTTVKNGSALTNQQGGGRKLAGCQDTDNNNADFDVLSGSALLMRNSSSPTHTCSGPTSPSGVG